MKNQTNEQNKECDVQSATVDGRGSAELETFVHEGVSDRIWQRYASLIGCAGCVDVTGRVAEQILKCDTKRRPDAGADATGTLGIPAATDADSDQVYFGELDSDVVVLDTETTGFSFNHDELTQVAAARLRNGKIMEWFVTFVNPGRPIPEDVARLTDIHDEDVADAPTPAAALAELVKFVGDSYVVAHNAGFDQTFCTKTAEGAELNNNVWIDTLDLARIALPRLKSHRLVDLARTFGTPISTHRADDDVATTCRVYRILLHAIEAMPQELVYEISQMATLDEWPTVAVFQWFANAAAEQVSSFNLAQIRNESLKEGQEKRGIRADAETLAADPTKELLFPEAAVVAEAFSADGLVGSLYENFENRAEQNVMAEAVRHAFESSKNLVVEAGTGVGKSMAYLVPAALSAKMNNICVGVATKTNGLLDQLVHKELPLLNKALESQGEKPVAFSALKGFSHYPCLRQVNRTIQEGATTKKIAGKELPVAPSLAALLSFIEQSEYDDIDSLKIDYRVLPRYLFTTSSRECLRRKCPFFGTSCFVHGARRQAETADIVVTNHSLLFCDLMADGGLLPPVRHWVVDEAHNAEKEARGAFSLEIAAEEMLRLSQKVAAESAGRNVFVRAQRRLGGAFDESTLFHGLISKACKEGKEFEVAAGEFAVHMKDLLFFNPSGGNKGYEYVELWLNDEVRQSETFGQLSSYGKVFCDRAEKLIAACQGLVAFLEELDEAAELQREIASIALDLKDMLNTVEIILFVGSSEYAYAAVLSKKKDRVVEKLQALLFNVGEKMNETLFANTHSVVFSSATLAIDGSFSAFEQALGLNTNEASTATFLEIGSSYDFDSQMMVYVASDMPEPSDLNYLAALERLLIETHRAQNGSMLTLFTNRKEMEKCFEVVAPALKEDDLRVVCQKWGVSVKGLRDDFLTDEHLSLFALKNFWEGFDAPGATLKGVIIPKLPFSKPTDPLSCERSLRDDQAWRHYVLPSAVLEIKQAAGRLIRSAEDSGCLILADKRLVSKGYGKVFLNSLPSKNIKICTMAEIVEELEQL